MVGLIKRLDQSKEEAVPNYTKNHGMRRPLSHYCLNKNSALSRKQAPAFFS